MTLPLAPLGKALRLSNKYVEVEPDGVYPITGIYSFGRGLIRRPAIVGDETSYRYLSLLRQGQLVISKLNAWEGALSVVPADFSHSYVSPEYPVFDIDPTVADQRYIAYLVSWPELWKKLTPRGSMVRRKRTHPELLLRLEVPFPDIDEQRRIGAKLDSSFSCLSNVDKLRVHASRLRGALIEALIETAAQHPSCKPVPLADILRLERIPVDVDPTRKYIQIGIKSFGRGIFHREPVLGGDLSKLRYFEVHPRRLIVSNIMAWEGAIAVSTDRDAECVASHRFLSYAPVGDVDLSFLNSFFRSREGRRLIKKSSTGTVMRNQTLSIDDFEALHVPLPDVAAQRTISKAVAWCDKTTLLAEEQAEILPALRHSVLNAAFSGQI
jgi:type I restriction enzyme, S subunit